MCYVPKFLYFRCRYFEIVGPCFVRPWKFCDSSVQFNWFGRGVRP